MQHIGFDTETQRGKAVLCATPTSDLLFPRRLQDVLDWLAVQGETFLAWNADYDIQAILRLVTDENALARLGLTHSVHLGDLHLKYIPDKYFVATWPGNRITIYDLMQFFGGSLDRAATKYLGVGKNVLSTKMRVYLKAGLLGSALRDKSTAEECRSYCMVDAKRVEQLGEIMEASVTAAGLKFDHPASCAALARQRWGSELAGKLPRRLHRHYEYSYHGGRMEVTRRGYIKDVSCWDIHSAYPAVLTDLPSTDDCDDLLGKYEPHPDAAYGTFYAVFRLPHGAPVYPVCCTHPLGHLFYPSGVFTTWADLQTVNVTRELFGRQSVQVEYSHQFLPKNHDETPFSEMRQMYVDRKSKPELNLALKLVMNSTYGLLAESLKPFTLVKGFIRTDDAYAGGGFYRRKRFPGPGSNPAIAGAVTGATRAKMIRDTYGLHVHSFATDGVIMAEGEFPHGVMGDALGEWGFDGHGDALIVGSGVYAFRDRDAEEPRWHTKSRGYGHLGSLWDLLSNNKMRRLIPIRDLRAKTLREFAKRRDVTFAQMNHLRNSMRVLNLRFDAKRDWRNAKPRAKDFLSGSMGSDALHSYGGPDRMMVKQLLLR